MKNLRYPSPVQALAISATALSLAPAIQAAEDHNVWSDLLLPALEAKCSSCHGPEKQKGKLRTDSYAALIEGGSEGASIVPGSLDDSLMWFRVDLPLDDDEHMPPEGKDQLTKAETELLKLWIMKGADEKAKLSQLGLPEDLKPGIEEMLAAAKAQPEKKELTEDEKKALEEKAKLAEQVMEKVNATGATLMPVAQNTPQLRFSALNVVDQFGDEQLKALAPVADQIVWLDLARTKVTDKGLAQVKAMENLTKLHLENTGVTDAGLAELKGLKNLEYLNLYRTPVTDAGVAHLAGLTNLKRLYLWQSKATPKSVDTLKKTIPELVVNLGWEFEDKAKVVQVAENKPAEPKAEEKKPEPAPAPKAEEKKPAPAPAPKAEEKKPAPTPAPKPEEKKPEPTPAPKAEVKKTEPAKPASKPEEKKPEPAKPAPKAEEKKPEPAKPAPKAEEKKPEPAKPAAPAPTLSTLEASLKADLDSANAMIANARKSADQAVTAAEEARKAAEEAMKLAEAKMKAAEAAKKNVADIEAVAAAISEALKVAQSKK